MTPTGRAPRVTACAEAELKRSGLRDNPYLRSLADGRLSLDDFRHSQEQFYYAVAYFPRPMAALLSRLPDPLARLDILHNLVEEHGDFEEARFHATTFRRFLHSIGARSDELRSCRPKPAVHA